MSPEEIRKSFAWAISSDNQIQILAEIAAQLAELNEKFADFFATDPTVYVPRKVEEEVTK